LKCLQGKTVLLVDDHPSSLAVLQQHVQGWGMHATLCSGGREAISILEKPNDTFDFVIIDAHMPDVDGFYVANFIKTLPSYMEGRATVIMMLSSTTHRTTIDKTPNLPISVYLYKPIMELDLLDALLKPFRQHVAKEISHFSPQQHSPCAAPDEGPKKNIKVLLAEDNVVNQRLAIRMLEKLGYSVTLAANGVEAVKAVEREGFQLILMDVQMPEMGGFEATARIREIERNTGKRTPIIAMTAHAIQGYREKCLEGGMDDYISKPIRMDSLRKTLEEFLSKYTHPDAHHHQSQHAALSH